MTIAIYPGSFDPITLGHIDIVRRTLSFAQKMIIAIGENQTKSALFDVSARTTMIRESLVAENIIPDRESQTQVTVVSFTGLLVTFAREVNADVIVRGIRAASDFEFEFQMASMNRSLESRLVTLFLAADDRYHFVSSQLVKEIANNGGNVDSFVSPPVQERLRQHYTRNHNNTRAHGR